MLSMCEVRKYEKVVLNNAAMYVFKSQEGIVLAGDVYENDWEEVWRFFKDLPINQWPKEIKTVNLVITNGYENLEDDRFFDYFACLDDTDKILFSSRDMTIEQFIEKISYEVESIKYFVEQETKKVNKATKLLSTLIQKTKTPEEKETKNE